MKNLHFDYPSNAKIRIKRKNCYENDKFPCVYGIVTKKLSFVVPKKFTLFSKQHVFIPLSYYQTILVNYYKNITK